MPEVKRRRSAADPVGDPNLRPATPVMKKLITIGLAVVVVSALGLFRADGDRDAVKEEAVALVESLPSYEEHEALLTAAFEAHHDAAFEEAYTYGSRRRGASFEWDEYVPALFGQIAEEARREGEAELADEVETHAVLLGAFVEAEE